MRSRGPATPSPHHSDYSSYAPGILETHACPIDFFLQRQITGRLHSHSTGTCLQCFVQCKSVQLSLLVFTVSEKVVNEAEYKSTPYHTELAGTFISTCLLPLSYS